MQGINDLGIPTINGLKSLNLDELETTVLNANTIDGNIIYYNRIEGNEIIVDTKLTLTNTGVIAVGDKFISDIELTYLDGVNDNIQKQNDNIAGQDLQFQAQIDNHTNQIEDYKIDITHSNQIEYLQISDTNQNTAINNLNYEVNQHDFTLTAHTTQITALQNSDSTQNTNITNLQNSVSTHTTQITALQNSDTTQNTNITNLQNSVSTHTTQITALQNSDTTK